MKRDPIYGLDFIRFSAACAVVFWHLGYRFFDGDATRIRKMIDGLPPGTPPFTDWTQWGWIGVQIFFAISGFIITYSTHDTSPWNFFERRIGRLIPGIIICSIIIIGIDIYIWDLPIHGEVGKLARSFAFYPSGPWIAPQYWTLPVEVAFYGLVWLFVLINRTDRMEWLALGILVISGLYWTANILFGFSLRADIANIFMLNYGIYFSFGIALSLITSGKKSCYPYIIMAFSSLIAIRQIQYSLKKYGLDDPNYISWSIPYLIWVFSVGAIFISIIKRRAFSKFVDKNPVVGKVSRTLGLATYPLYLIHIHVGGAAATGLIRSVVNPIIAVILGGIICVPFSIITAIYGEPPLRRLVVSSLRRARNFVPLERIKSLSQSSGTRHL